MKEIIAIIRHSQWQKTKAGLAEEGFPSITVQKAFGRGKQKGLRYLSQIGKSEAGIRLLPRRIVTLCVRDEDAAKVIDILIVINRTGEIGDGKIFVCPLEGIERLRTGEKGEAAI
ncbi:hypothetical protein A3H38_06925 [candidate division WOR-1 bacterium RIFCSPLOWO2_02_FULL_46_20]|uniref:Transcriptional regulator n=2 Tax=Saganbacteria TaxID=1703751 RepID=A0A1F4R893_UNCSA|nr:MAG: hypothetical protein A3H38_06925 [candidate division WOR-1 bacterium RIFCSPLOWO2_02_FULL_46_20]OGC10128.1 MAG: hypothetical protein A3F86_02115 [candidate division WOR-1 bacterium RIFCSPLOWO2_12_FULL_45_9]